jgi:hypothetical protein
VARVGRSLRLSALAVALAAAVAGGALRPAVADDGGRHWGQEHYVAPDRGWRQHDWRERVWREREWRAHHHYAHAAPGYFYAPPAVVYVPPPEPPSINFVIPLGRRW